MARHDAPPDTSPPMTPRPGESDRRAYSRPEIARLGSVRDLTLGREHLDTADMDKARYN